MPTGGNSSPETALLTLWPPPLREHFLCLNEQHTSPLLRRPRSSRQSLDRASSPVLVVVNKHENEWTGGPINFMTPKLVSRIVDEFRQVCGQGTMVYSHNRGRVAGMARDSQEDLNSTTAFPNGLPEGSGIEVVSMESLFKEFGHVLSPNEIQARVFVEGKCFVDVQGGMSILSQYMGQRYVPLQVKF